jgi:hypothetical protein
MLLDPPETSLVSDFEKKNIFEGAVCHFIRPFFLGRGELTYDAHAERHQVLSSCVETSEIDRPSQPEYRLKPQPGDMEVRTG